MELDQNSYYHPKDIGETTVIYQFQLVNSNADSKNDKANTETKSHSCLIAHLIVNIDYKSTIHDTFKFYLYSRMLMVMMMKKKIS